MRSPFKLSILIGLKFISWHTAVWFQLHLLKESVGIALPKKTALFMGMRSARRRHLKGNSYHDDISSLNCVHALRETTEKQKGCETKRLLRRQLVPFFTVWNLEH